MKKVWKRYLCFILSAALLLTMIPCAEAVAEERPYTESESLFAEDEPSDFSEDSSDPEPEESGLTEEDPKEEELEVTEPEDPSEDEQGGPSDDPEIPSEDPTVPSEDPTVPSEDLTDPSEDLTDPSEDPEIPSDDPAAPEEDPDIPSGDPADPSEDPDIPADDPAAPSEGPDVPSDDPAAQDVSSDDPAEPEDEPFEILEPEEEALFHAESETEEEQSGLIELASAVLKTTTYTYKGVRIKPLPVVTSLENGQEIMLQKGTDYTLRYRNNLDAGKATIIVSGTGNYTGTLTVTFRIKPVTIQNAEIKYTKRTYTGKALTQTKTTVVTARVNRIEQILTLGTDYVITYENNKKVGTARLIVTGCGNFTGSVTKEFSIIPPQPTIKSAYAGTKRLTVKWEEQTTQTGGFQLQYSTEKDFSSGRKTITIGGTQRTSYVIEDLEVWKTYSVRLRAYKKVDGIRYYSNWSEVRTIRLKGNAVVVSGSGAYRTVSIHNPKASVKKPKVAIWSQTKGQDDLKWYSMKLSSNGSWYVKVPAAWLDHYGICQAHVYSGDTFVGSKTFSVSEEDYKLTRNTIAVTGSGIMSEIWLLHPAKKYTEVEVAVWSEKNGQDDLAWVTLTKNSNGSWSTKQNLTSILHSGKVHVHLYANTTTFLGTKTFSVKFGMEPCSTEEEYIKKIAPAIQRVCKKFGYLPSVLIAQSCLENGFGIPSYWDNPEISGLIYYNNMVGLKSELLSASWEDYTVWGGKSIVKKTPEVYNGQSVIITDSFRVYDSIEQSFADYLLFMTYASNYGPGGKPKYGPEILAMKSPSQLIKNVAKRGYATGTTYPTSVMKIVNRHDLTKYDDLTNVRPTSYGP